MEAKGSENMCASHINNGLYAVLEQHIKKYCDTAVIKRGYQYYQDGLVESIRTSEFNAMYGIVNGTNIYAVVLDTEHFQYSSCSCPFEGHCKHMAAVFFQYCSMQQSHLYAQGAYFRMLGLQSAAELAASSQGPNPETTEVEQLPLEIADAKLKPMDWLEWMDNKYGETWKRCRNSIHPLIPILSSLKGMAKDWDKPLQRLHWSVSILFVLEQAERALHSVDSFSRYYHEVSYSRLAEPWLESLYSYIDEFEPNRMNEEEWEWVDVIYGICKGNALRTGDQLIDWTAVSFAIIEKCSENRSWYDQELSKLLQEEADALAESTNTAYLHASIGLFYFLDMRDEQAIAYFSKVKFERSQKIMYPCAAKRMEEQKWELVLLWMSFFYERIYPIRSPRNVGVFLTLCRRGDKDRPDLSLWNEYMLALLPHSYYELSEHLVDQSAYREWADLQLLMGIAIDDIDTQTLREISKNAPRALMPLYHQSIDAFIQTRNRQGYRMAVKGLKKLEKLYKADKDMTRWNSYIQGIAHKHQRLRAFQEELWKGKLIT